MTIAGHDFALTASGRRCILYCSATGGTCGIPWLHVRSCRVEDIEVTPGLAHHGNITKSEYNEIRTEVDKEEAAIWDAVIDAASAGAR